MRAVAWSLLLTLALAGCAGRPAAPDSPEPRPGEGPLLYGTLNVSVDHVQ